jgi:homoserine O-acetyltransferase
VLVEKKTFVMSDFRTVGGQVIPEVRIGWESYGTLAPDRSNAVLVTHYFSGTSHAAGRYAGSDELAGYWDAIIGPGKAIDTNRFFVISSDTLVNLNVPAPHVVTTGPATIDPATGRPYGMRFPLVTIRDFVAVQKALLDSLGIGRLRAVAGPSMGALQAYEWALAYPEMVERIIPVIGAAGGHPSLIAWLDAWGTPIRVDPLWNGGDYYGGRPPLAGLAASLKLVSLHANGWDWARTTFGRDPARPDADPAQRFENRFRIVAALDADGVTRANTADPNHLLYLVKANQLAAADPARIHVPTLLVSSPTDLVFPPEWMDRTAAAIAGNGTVVERAEVTGQNGHLNGLAHIAKAGPAIAEFLARPF